MVLEGHRERGKAFGGSGKQHRTKSRGRMSWMGWAGERRKVWDGR